MTWLKHSRGDRWFLFSTPDGGDVRTALGAVERIGIAYESRDQQGNVIARHSTVQLAMRAVEKAERA